MTGVVEHIEAEPSLREETDLPTLTTGARTLLLDPHSRERFVAATRVRTLDPREAYAEKIRAALTRREPAIRDFFDIDHAVRLGLITLRNPELRDLVARKLRVPGNDAVNLSDAKVANRRDQLEADLRPVLQETDFVDFRLHGVLRLLQELVSDQRSA